MAKGLQLPRDFAIAYGLKKGWVMWKKDPEYKRRVKAREKAKKDKEKRAKQRIKDARKRIKKRR